MRFEITAADVATQIKFLNDLGCSGALLFLRITSRDESKPALARMALTALYRRKLRQREARRA